MSSLLSGHYSLQGWDVDEAAGAGSACASASDKRRRAAYPTSILSARAGRRWRSRTRLRKRSRVGLNLATAFSGAENVLRRCLALPFALPLVVTTLFPAACFANPTQDTAAPPCPRLRRRSSHLARYPVRRMMTVALATIPQLIAAIRAANRQATTAERQAEVATKQADVAVEQATLAAEHIRLSARALLVLVKELSSPFYFCSVENLGAGVALEIQWWEGNGLLRHQWLVGSPFQCC
jgi:hypothetical protein